MSFTIAVGGDPKFIEDMSRALPVAGIAVAAAAGDPAALCGEAARAGCAGVLVPSDWAGEAPRFVREIVGARVFIAGKVPKEVVDSWDPFTEARTFVVPPEPHKAVLAVEKLLGVAPRAPHPDGAEEGPAPDPSADTDPLTGCCTRRAAGFLQLEGPYAVVFIDLDGFKAVNDNLGHEAGDRVLAAFGRMLLDNLKGKDTPIRWGGDEFVLVLPDTGQEGARRLAENLLARWEKQAPYAGSFEAGFSYGLAAGAGMRDFDKAVNAADAAMYAMKRRKKKVPFKSGDRFLIFHEDSPGEILAFLSGDRKVRSVVFDCGGSLARVLGVGDDALWKHDWRSGLAAEPYRYGDSEIYFAERLSEEEDPRDLRALGDILRQVLTGKTRVILNNASDGAVRALGAALAEKGAGERSGGDGALVRFKRVVRSAGRR